DVPPALLQFKDAALVLWHLDLSPAQKTLRACYAKSPHGGDPWPPVLLLRTLLLMLLVGETSINDFVAALKGNRVLRRLSASEEEERPGVGTLYDFLHRLHDGPVRQDCPHLRRPSVAERRRAQTPKPKAHKPHKPKLSKAERRAQAAPPEGRGDRRR